jgi:hypothetical protein
LNGYTFSSANMTNELCATTCASRNFTIAGAEYGREVSLSLFIGMECADITSAGAETRSTLEVLPPFRLSATPLVPETLDRPVEVVLD